MSAAEPLDFREASRREPCPVCGGVDWCALTQRRPDGTPGPVRCMRWSRPGVTVAGGWKPVKEAAADGGRLFAIDSAEPYTPPSREAVQAQKEVEAVRAEKQRQKAKAVWKDAEPGHDAVDRYIEGRGIPIAALPGRSLPPVMRFGAQTLDEWQPEKRRYTRSPAMVCVVQDGSVQGKILGVHRTFLEIGDRVTKRAESAKKQLGPCSGGSIRLNTDTRSGVLVLGEGIETCLACLASTGAAVLCCMDSKKLVRVQLPVRMVGRGIPDAAAVVVIAADLDRSGEGLSAAAKLADRLRREYPHLLVVIRAPTRDVAPNLVVGEGEDSQPGDNVGKSVDWDDVHRTHGPEAVARGLLGGIDVEAAKRRANDEPPAEASGDAGEPGFERIIGGSRLERARRYLVECESPSRKTRPKSGHLLRYWSGRWWEYTGSRYIEVDKELVHARVMGWLDGFVEISARGEVRPVEPSANDITDVMAAMRGEVYVQSREVPAWLTATYDDAGKPRWGIASIRQRDLHETPVASGNVIAYSNLLLDVDAWATGELKTHTHSPNYFAFTAMPYAFPVEAVRRVLASGDTIELDALVGKLCPTWLDFLGGIYGEDLEWHDALQEWFGYLMIPDNFMEKMLALVGPPRSGKGTIFTGMEAMLGEENIAGGVTFRSLAEKTGLAQLEGKLAAIMPDAHVSKKIDSTAAVEVLKSITGNDLVRIEEKFEKAYSGRLFSRITMAVNELPNLQDSSLALAHRMILLKTGESHLGREDDTLKDRIRAEQQGINLWALVGLRRLWQRPRRHIVQPASGVELLDAIRREQSPISVFLEDACVVESNQSVPVGDLFQVWEQWCTDNKRQPGSPQSFGRKLRAMVSGLRETRPRAEGGGRARVYEGIGISADYLPTIQADLPGLP